MVVLNSLLTYTTLRATAKLLLLELSGFQSMLLVLLSISFFWWPLLSLVGMGIVIVVQMKGNAQLIGKYILIVCLVTLIIGGCVQLASSSIMMTSFVLLTLLLVVRIGRSLFISSHAFQHVHEIKVGNLQLKAYWDSGNLCREPLSSLPVHFIRQEVVAEHPHMFQQSWRQVATATVAKGESFTLVKPLVPIYCQGKPLPPCYLAPIAKTTLPFESDILLHNFIYN